MTHADWPLEDERILLADACTQNFWLFLKYSFGVALNPLGAWLCETGKYNHKDMCYWLQKHVLDKWIKPKLQGERLTGRKRLLVNIPRYHGKTVLNKALQMFISLHLSDASILNGSYSADKSQKVLYAVRALYEGTDQYGLFAWLFGVWYNPERTWTDAKLVHAARKAMGRSEPSNYTCSIETGATGDHPDIYSPDDLISGDKMKDDSDAHMTTAVRHMGRMIPVVLPGGMIILWGTRYADSDVIGEAIYLQGVYEIAGMEPSDERIKEDPKGAWAMYYLEADLGDDEDGFPMPTMPTCNSREDLKAWRDAYPKDYAAQMKNRPDVGGHQAITREMIEEMKTEKLPAPGDCFLTVHMDTAFRNKKKVASSDWSVIVVFAHYTDDSGRVCYVDGVGSKNWKSDQFYNRVYDMIARWDRKNYRVRVLTDETETGGKAGTSIQTLRNKFVQRNKKRADGAVRMPPYRDIQRQSGPKKTDRILDAALYWASGHVFLWRGARGLSELEGQMLRIGMSRHDDWADAAADVFSTEVYKHARAEIDSIQGHYPIRKGDDVLQEDGYISDDEARMYYDQVVREEGGRTPGRWVREPIH